MKKIIFYLFIGIIPFVTKSRTFAQNANTSLSNLTKTSINQNISPKKTNAYNLGSKDSAWKNIFLRGSLIIDSHKFISNPGSFNNFIGFDAGKSLTNGNENTGVGYSSLNSLTSGVAIIAKQSKPFFKHNFN